MRGAIGIRGPVIDAMVDHARRARPLECCGLLLGGGTGIDEAVPARNIRASVSRYEIDPEDHFAAIRRARATGREVCGAYHSHPRGPARPSATDLAEAHDSTLLYVIVSLEVEPPIVAGFRLHGGNFESVELVPLP